MKKFLLYTLFLVIGILLGITVTLYSAKSYLKQLSGLISQKENESKIGYLLNALDQMYVDSIDIEKIDEATVALALEQLDPHSSYIPKEDMEEANQELTGSFSGVGIQFNIQQDTVYVVDVIPGGPSERAGILAGDRITHIDDSLFVGKKINTEKVFKTLRGKKNSIVNLTIARRGTSEPLKFKIKRDDIPVHTVNAAHMVAPDIGYINISSFGQNTYSETLTALAKIKKQGATSVIIDLRGNSGGYLDAASKIINEFLEKGDLIVYLEGRAYARQDIKANGIGSFQEMKVTVLIDEFSGSASEIFAGAIQDNDRGTIIGRRSFGKGLVQQPVTFKDGSEARITIARYYTPAGRCIQKPYERGKQSDYYSDLWNRYVHGEFFNADSIHQNDTTKYYTKEGRVVYGGGGIMPDIFIGRDTIGFTPSFTRLVNKTAIYRFALKYVDTNRAELKKFKSLDELEAYLLKQNLVDELVNFAKSEKIEVTPKDLAISKSLISQHINSYIVRSVLTEDDFYHILNKYDKTVIRAIKETKK